MQKCKPDNHVLEGIIQTITPNLSCMELLVTFAYETLFIVFGCFLIISLTMNYFNYPGW